MDKEQTQIEVINSEINRELANNDVAKALLATTFKGLSPIVMKQAIMDGMIRGFSFLNFRQKDVYAIPYGQSYSLVTAIDYSRKIGMRSGIVGKDAPVYTDDKDGKLETCSVTIYKKTGDYIGKFTATVYFSEYSTGRNLWLSKPRTMIAKVAEMHALRMACPEELSKQYIEEEVELETPQSKENKIKDLVGESKLQIKDITNEKPSTKEKKSTKENKDEVSSADSNAGDVNPFANEQH